MVRTGPNEYKVRTMESKPIRTHSNSLGAHLVVRTQWRCTPWKRLAGTGSRRLKQSFGCGGNKLVLYFIRVLHSSGILLQIWYVTFRMMKFLGLSIGLQIFAVVLDSFWKHTGVICRMVNSIQRKIYIWSVEDNSYWGPDRTMKTDRTFGSNQCELPRFGPMRTMESHSIFEFLGQWGLVSVPALVPLEIYVSGSSREAVGWTDGQQQNRSLS